MENPKYAVLKWEDWQGITEDYPEQCRRLREGTLITSVHLDALVLRDAEVIRQQDITSGPLFHLYSHLIHTFIDLELAQHGMSAEQILVLTEIADHFAQAGDAADEIRLSGRSKLPD